MTPRLFLLLFLTTLTLLRWAFLASADMSPESAYLALCGFQPGIANFDGPAGTALCVAWGTHFIGSTALGATFTWPLFAALASFALFELVKPVASSRVALSLAILLNLIPIFNDAALSPSPAMPLAMFSTAYFAFAGRAIKQNSILHWLCAGLCAAGGLFFTYSAWFLLLALILVLASSRRWHLQFLSIGFWLSILPLVAVSFLLLSWNANHDWVHFIGSTFQSSLSMQWSALPSASWFALAALSPFVALILIIAVFCALKNLRSNSKTRFLAIPAIFASILALYTVLQNHDSLTLGLTATAFLLSLLAFLPSSFPRPVLSILFLATALWTSFSIAFSSHSSPLITNDVSREIESLRISESSNLSSPVFLIAENAPMASLLGVLLKDTSFVALGHPPVYVPESAYADSQFAVWPRYDQFVESPTAAPNKNSQDPFTEQRGINPFLGRSALYITTQTPEQLPQSITAAFASWHHLADIATPSGSPLHIYLCSDYETLPL